LLRDEVAFGGGSGAGSWPTPDAAAPLTRRFFAVFG
jgi:hypothetical protein